MLGDRCHGADCPFDILYYSFWLESNTINRIKRPAVGTSNLLWRCKGEEPGVAAAMRGPLPGHDDVAPRAFSDVLIEGGVQQYQLG